MYDRVANLLWADLKSRLAGRTSDSTGASNQKSPSVHPAALLTKPYPVRDPCIHKMTPNTRRAVDARNARASYVHEAALHGACMKLIYMQMGGGRWLACWGCRYRRGRAGRTAQTRVA